MSEMTETKKTRKQLFIFLLVAYGVTYLTGFLAWYGNDIGSEMYVFPNAQMFYPAAGVMLAYLLTQWQDALLPKSFFICFLLFSFLMLALSVLSVAMPEQQLSLNGQQLSLWLLLTQYIPIISSLVCWIPLLATGKKRRAAYGLRWKHGKASLLCILIFFLLYFGRAAIIYAIQGQADIILEIIKNPFTWNYLLLMPVNFFIAFTPFLGEEYGWRHYLQPLLQKRFGMRRGVLLLGFAWGIWHIFLDFFFYTTPDNGIIMTVSQIINCTTLGIFLAWAYLKTENIWVPVIIHLLNNNLSLVVANDYSTDILEHQQIAWSVIPQLLLSNGLLFGLFLLSKEFRKK